MKTFRIILLSFVVGAGLMKLHLSRKEILVVTETETTIDSIYVDHSGNIIDHVITNKLNNN